MKVGFLITARLKSTRLPKKLLREIKGKPIISHMLDRVKLSKAVKHIIICTSESAQDRPLIEIAEQNNVDVYLGDTDDVLARLSGAAEQFNLDYVLNITGDCPFVDPFYADKIVEAYKQTQADLIRAFDLPHGAFSYGICPKALKKILKIKDSRDTEVWGRYFTDTDLFEVYDLPITNPLHRKPDLRMTLDYPEDLAFFETVFDHLYQEGKVFSLDEIILLLEKHPEIVDINRACATAFKRRFNDQSEIQLKPRYQISKVALVGCGSIGQRHARNLYQLGVKDIIAFRTRQGFFQELSTEKPIHETSEWDEVVSAQPDIAIVSNPTSLHMETVERLLPVVKGVFIEKPLFGSLNGAKELLGKIKASKVISFVGYHLQFHPAIKVIQDILNRGDLGAPLVFQCQAGHWLPDWHPYEDYRHTYAARKDLGGGVALTLSHEIHLAIDLLGPGKTVCAFFPKTDKLALEVDVIADLMIWHSSGSVSQIHLDFIQRHYNRSGIISCEKGWIRYDLTTPLVLAQYENEGSPRLIWDGSGYDPNKPYYDEMVTFLKYVREGRMHHPLDAWQAAHSLAVIDTAFTSAKTNRISDLPKWVYSK